MLDNFMAKEVQRSTFCLFCLFILFALLQWLFLAFISFSIMLFLIYVYRVKSININKLQNKHIYSPIDGKIGAIDTKGSSKLIYIDVNLFHCHILRALESSSVKVELKRGLNLNSNSFKAQKLNERASIEFKNTKLNLISSLSNINLIHKQDFLKGEKLGIFLQGQVIVQLNGKFNLNINIGDKLKSGKTIIASLK